MFGWAKKPAGPALPEPILGQVTAVLGQLDTVRAGLGERALGYVIDGSGGEWKTKVRP